MTGKPKRRTLRTHRRMLAARGVERVTSVAFVLARCKREGDCMIWQGAVTSGVYGVLRFGGRIVYAHRLALYLSQGPIPKHKVVCHSCDAPRCCEPTHLSAGTYGRNLQEAWHRKRRCRPSTLTGEA